jgi:phage terminase Nu1 subunit (DNA packaging protein)
MKFNNQRLIENSRTYLSSEIIDPIYNTDQLMNLLTVSRRTVQNWRDKGLIAFSAIQNKIYYRHSDIIAFLNTHKIDSYNGK